MKRSLVRSLVSGCAAPEPAGRLSQYFHAQRHRRGPVRCAFGSSAVFAGIASSTVATGEKQGISRSALRHQSTTAPKTRAIHSGSCPRQQQYQYRPNLKCECQDQHNAQPFSLERLTWSGCQSRSSHAEPQFNQRANPSFKRTCQGLRPCPSA